MKPILFLSFAFVASGVSQTSTPPESTTEIVQKYRKNPSDAQLIVGLAARKDDPQVIPALRELFIDAKSSDARDSTVGWPIARLIAYKLVTLGVKDEVYFEEVARYAREGIAADPPPPYLPDATGSYDNQVRNPSYEKWCAARNLEWVACTKKYGAMVMDIQFLDGLHDSRAIPVLRSGLAATDSGVVTYSVAGLAMLDDKESFPLITQACARFPQKEAESIVILGAAHFDDPSVLALYDAFIKDPKTREKAKEEWRAQHGHAP